MLNFCKKNHISTSIPWRELSNKEKNLIWFGYQVNEDQKHNWNGVKSFFDQIQKKSYKMHVRVFWQNTEDISNAQIVVVNDLIKRI